MRKNTARKWVHLLLDLLPVLIIPIFAIYLINHNPQGLQVETGGYEIQEKYQTNEVNDFNDIVVGNIYHSDLFYFTNYDFRKEFHIYILNINNETTLNFSHFIFQDELYISTYNANTYNYISLYVLDDYSDVSNSCLTLTNELASCTFFSNNVNEYEDLFYIEDFDFYIAEGLADFIDICDNEGFEITKSNFNVYDVQYNEGMIYDNTDIGSQLIYSMYIPVHDYFNMTNLFNFGDIYTWINNSMFSGNAPLPIFIVYNVIVYEFLIDLIFLIYSIFMFIIDFSSELLARCFSFSNKGGTR